jgi:hypothetical protein
LIRLSASSLLSQSVIATRTRELSKPGAGGASGATPAHTGINPFASSAAWARLRRLP